MELEYKVLRNVCGLIKLAYCEYVIGMPISGSLNAFNTRRMRHIFTYFSGLWPTMNPLPKNADRMRFFCMIVLNT